MSTTTIRYRAFISYSHHDEAWGRWLHSTLERYRVDKGLVGRETPAGVVPKTLRIFRDRTDFSAGHSLTEQTRAALDASQFLVVLCSPSAAGSKYVSEEVRHFKATGRGRNIIPIIVDGEPGDAGRECFPQALRFEVGVDGALTSERAEPIAADARSHGDGKGVALQKVVAGLLGLGLDEITRRSQQAQQRHARRRNAIIAVLLGLTLLSGAGFFWARYELQRNEVLIERTLKRATGIITKAVGLSRQFGAPISVTVTFLEEAESILSDITEYGSSRSPKVLATKAWMLIQFGESYAVLGHSDIQRERVSEALRIFTRLSAEHPNDPAYQYSKALAEYALGRVEITQGRFDQSLELLRSAELIVTALAATDPKYAEGDLPPAELQTHIGDVLMERGNFSEATLAYRSAQSLVEARASADSANPEWQYALATLKAKIGDTFLRQLNHADALSYFKQSLPILSHLTAKNPANSAWQNQFAVVQARVGLILRFRRDFDGALAAFRTQLAVQQRLAGADPKNTFFQHNLASAYHGLGEVHIDRLDFDSALDALKSSLAIRQRLASTDTKNVQWLLGIASTQNQIGEVYRLKGLGAEALESFAAALETSKRLVDQDRNVPLYKVSLIVAHQLMAELLVSQAQPDRAAIHFKDAIAVADSLIKSHSEMDTYQLLLSGTYISFGNFLLDQNSLSEAVATYNDGMRLAAHAAKLASNSLDDVRFSKDATINIQDYLRLASNAYQLAIRVANALMSPELKHLDTVSPFWFDQITSTFEKNSEKFARLGLKRDALEVAATALQVRERRAAASPRGATQRLLVQAYERVGDRHMDLEMFDDALSAYAHFLNSAERRAKEEPGNTTAQRDYSVGFEKYGNALFQLRRINEALNAHQSALEIRTRLAADDPDNVLLQRDLARSLVKAGEVNILAGNHAEGVASLHRVLEMCKEFAKRSPIEIDDALPCALSFWRIGNLRGTAGLEDLKRAHGILDHFNRSSKLSLEHRNFLVRIEGEIELLTGVRPRWGTKGPEFPPAGVQSPKGFEIPLTSGRPCRGWDCNLPSR